MTKMIEAKYNKKIRGSLSSRITKGEGVVAHWIWKQPKNRSEKTSNIMFFMTKEYSANYLVAEYLVDSYIKSPRKPHKFVERPMSHILVPICGNQRCARPDHQEWVEIRKYQARTTSRGDSHGKILMTSDKVRELYKLLDSEEYNKLSKKAIAERFGVGVDTIYSYRRRWESLKFR